MTCPAPIGTIPKEDCAAIAADFGALNVEKALLLAASGKNSEQRLAAVRAVETLGRSIKDRRVALCERYVKCTVPQPEHDTEDQALTGAMHGLVDLWTKRRFSSPDEIIRFRESVRLLERQAFGGGDVDRPPPPPARRLKAEEALARIEDPEVAFRTQPGAVTVSSTGKGQRDALLGRTDVLALTAGRRYRIQVAGTYRPPSPPKIAPGDELLARVKYRAEAGAQISLALRSIDDPTGTDSTETFRVNADDKGEHEAKLGADPQQTGFYLGLSVVKGAPVEVAELELLRGGTVLMSTRQRDAGIKTDCSGGPRGAHLGRLRCLAGEGDRLTLGKPESYLVVSARDSTGGLKGLLKTLSLEGGRSLDLVAAEGTRLVFTLVGAGEATITGLEISEIGR